MTKAPLPQIESAYWGFMLGGLVDIPLMLSYSDLLALPAVEITCGIAGHRDVRVNTWRGVRLQTLLDQVAVRKEAQHAHLFAADNYQTSIAWEHLGSAVLAYVCDGGVLSPAQGFPTRLIVPGLYGYKMPKHIARIALREQPLAGTWEQGGWSMDGVVETTSTITQPRQRQAVSSPVTFTGTAYAGTRTITQIELSIDNGGWMPVDFEAPELNHPVGWSMTWAAQAAGDYQVRVRATDSSGFTQTNRVRSTAKRASDIHTVSVRVVEVGG
jgi:hypothetical protein